MKAPLLSRWDCLPGALKAAGDGQGIDLLSSVQRITCSCLYRQDLGERRGTGVVLQVNDRAGKKIQVSARLIWSQAVACLPSTFFFSLGFFFHLFWEMNAFQGLQLSESNECHCSRADLCQLKIWPVWFSSHFFPEFFPLSSPFCTCLFYAGNAICHQYEHLPDTLLSAASPSLPCSTFHLQGSKCQLL